jgi:hypothetical protein
MTLSKSPLAPHMELSDGVDWLRTLPAMPKAVKIFDPQHAQRVKALDPGIAVVYRRFVVDQEPYLREGFAGGVRFVSEMGDLTYCDIIEGLNECTGFDDAETVRRANDMHRGFVAELSRRWPGKRAAILNIAVGNPREDLVALLRPCVQDVSVAGGYVGYHGYGPEEVLHGEYWLANRAPLLLQGLLLPPGSTRRIRWIYTEGIYDGCNSPLRSGAWKTVAGWRGMQHVLQEHELYARRAVELGIEYVFLFTFWGTPQWQPYEYTDSPEMMAWYREHLDRWSRPGGPPPPAAVRYRVTATSGLKLRARPAPNAVTLGNLPYGAVVEVLSIDGGYARLALTAGGATAMPGTSDRDAAAYVLAEWLEPLRE